MAKVTYDCSKCPGYCCSYPQITLKRRDVARLAKHFELTFEAAERKFTRTAYGEKWTMRRKKDEHFGKICRFFDVEKRNCGVYAARPEICRSYPNEAKCGYYDFLKFERKHQEDATYVARTDSGEWP
ncbi:MAG: YkgJ family cysteine cluster protein [Hyphomicrobiaceae bacterium]|nr:YkgJ family cysteine cluster protein [Hyphomicrobiaceae bacterium]